MEVLGKLAENLIAGCCVVVPGTATPGIAAPGCAAGTICTTGTSTTGSGWLFLCFRSLVLSFLRRDSSIPLLFYPLTLFLLPTVGGKIFFFGGIGS